MIHTAEKFGNEIRKSMNNVREVLRKAAYKGMEAAIKRVVEDSQVWSGSFVSSNRLGIGEENTAPPTNLKRYAPSVGESIVMASQTGGDKAIMSSFGSHLLESGHVAIPGSPFPMRAGLVLAESIRAKAQSGLLGKLTMNRSAIKPFGQLFLTNDVTDPKEGDYALMADEYSKGVYQQAFQMAELKAQKEFDKAKNLDKVSHL